MLIGLCMFLRFDPLTHYKELFNRTLLGIYIYQIQSLEVKYIGFPGTKGDVACSVYNLRLLEERLNFDAGPSGCCSAPISLLTSTISSPRLGKVPQT